MERWTGRVALVTGASVGIGAGICRELVRAGMTVIGCARNVQAIRDIAQEDQLKDAPGKLVAIRCDVSKEEDLSSLFAEIRGTFGRLDVCINNAGLSHDAPLLTGTTEAWRNMLDVNVLALCICTREAVKMMREKNIDDGQIIHIGSVGGHRLPSYPGVGGISFYCGTKHMVKMLTEGLRQELKTTGTKIRISSISPGIVETKFLDNFFKDNPNQNAEDVYGSFKPLTAKDVAEVVTYVLSSPPHVEVHDVIVRPIEQIQ